MTTDDSLQSCTTCRNFHVDGRSNQMCRLAPPQPLVVGMQQTKAPLLAGGAAAVAPIIQGVFSPTAGDSWCAQWRGRDFEGERPPLPVVAPGTRYRT